MRKKGMLGKHRNRLILLFFSILIMFCIVTGAVYTSQYLSDVGEANIHAALLSLRSVMASIDHSLQEASNLALLVGLDQSVQNALNQLKDEPKDSFDYMRQSHQLKDTLNNYINAHAYISNVIPITSNGNFLNEVLIYESEQMAVKIRLKELMDSDDFMMFWGNVAPLYSTPNDRVYVCVRKIYAINGTREVIGYVQVDLQPANIDNMVGNALSDGSAVFLYDSQGTPILTAGDESLGQLMDWNAEDDSAIVYRTGEKYLLVRVASAYSGWSIAMFMRYEGVMGNMAAAMTSIWISAAACLALGLLLAMRISRNTHRPLKQIIDEMHEIEGGNFDSRVNIHTGDEFETIGNGLNGMAERLKGLLQRLMKEQAMKKDAEMYALQAQINPHFLHNTLTVIRYLSRKGDNERCEQVTVALAELCNASMGGQRLLPLEEELKLARWYFQILQARYGDMISMMVRIPDDLKKCLIPRFTLQPLIENAVFHGLLLKDAGVIRIDVRQMKEELYIIVEDDGAGMSGEQVTALNDKLGTICTRKIYNANKVNHIGMENVSNRLKMEFGMDYGLTVSSELGHFTRITIRIPRHSISEEVNRNGL